MSVEKRMRVGAWIVGAATAATAGGVACGQTVHYPVPTFDRWNYPFNSQGGAGTEALVFGVLGALGVGQFDDRDGQFLTAWSTAGNFAPGLGAANYEIISARVTATIDPRFGNAFAYDPTADSYRTFLDPSDPDYVADGDVGRPIELFGTGYRNGFTAASFGENGPFAFGNPTAEGVRNAYARDLTGVDASNNVRDRFEATAMAIGQAPVAPGALVPGASAIAFDLDVSNPAIEAYIQGGLNSGTLSFTISSLHDGAFGGPPTFPGFMTKESSQLPVMPATLDLTVRVIPAPGTLAVLAFAGSTLLRRRR